MKRTTLDEFLDNTRKITDAELLECMADLATLAAACRRLGRAYHSPDQSAAHMWHALSTIASARGLTFPPFA